jgi:chemotaxis family two-component system sensor kinase Cph1
MNEAVFPPTPVEPNDCDREPIHIPGRILPHGGMLVVASDTLEVLQVAGDTQRLIGQTGEGLLGRALDAILSPGQVEQLRALIAAEVLEKPRHLLDPALRVIQARPLDASIHRIGEILIIELEAADPLQRHAADPIGCVQEMIEGLDKTPSLEAFCQMAAEHVRQVTGYDRTMVYRFMDDESGWVIAESREDRLEPFLGIHYPASDIPVQARALCLKTWVRLITQVDYEPAALIPAINPRTGQPLDMTYATLRDVSPVHRQYLRNMGVDATMSISIVVEGRLWGLIACHNYSPRLLPRHLRAVCELFGSIFSLQLQTRMHTEQFGARIANRDALRQLVDDLIGEGHGAQSIVRQLGNLLGYVEAGGIAVQVGGLIESSGATPSRADIESLLAWLTPRMDACDGIYATDRLADFWPHAATFTAVGAGLLALSIPRDPPDFILWFRPEAIQTVSWGGNPNKPMESGPNGASLTPRKSFEIWKQTMRGRSIQWHLHEVNAVFDLRVSLLEVKLHRIDAAARERERTFQHEQLLMGELDHRVKNTLANIQALITQTSRSSDSLADFVQGLNGRIQAMANAHSLLAKSRWEGVSVRALVAEELAPYLGGGTVVSLSGPEVVLTVQAALAVSLAVHELTTNAVKYGALSSPSGSVTVHWQPTGDGGMDMLWTESDGPRVDNPRRRGFGSTLIERALAMETDGTATILFVPEGVQCRIQLRAMALVSIGLDGNDDAAVVAAEAETVKPSETGRPRIFVVEDSQLVLMLIEQVIEDLGWEVVGPASTVAAALPIAREAPMDAALVDINLSGEMSWDVSAALIERGIPFALSTGYNASSTLPNHLKNAKILSKPFSVADLERCLHEMIAAGGSGRLV